MSQTKLHAPKNESLVTLKKLSPKSKLTHELNPVCSKYMYISAPEGMCTSDASSMLNVIVYRA